MVHLDNGRQNGYFYSNGSVKENIAKNEFVRAIRKKLMKERMKRLLG
jgi:hypothetical protein